MIKENKRGWVRLVEAFISILLIGIIMSIVISQQNPQKDLIETSISNYQIYMLRSIELNETLRVEILDNALTIPSNYSNDDFPVLLKNKIADLTPGYLTCEAKICSTDDLCNFERELTTDVYVQRIFIASTYGIYNPRQLKLFCLPLTT